MTDATTDSGETIRVEVFLRTSTSAAVVEPLRETVARARRLEDAMTEKNVTVCVKTWNSVRPALEELSDSGPSVSITVDSFLSWADNEGYTLSPSFKRRETSAMLDHRRATEIRVPTVCIAVYEDDDLQCVAPCSDGERTYTVDACLAALEAGHTNPFATRDEPSRDRSDDCVENSFRPGEPRTEELE